MSESNSMKCWFNFLWYLVGNAFSLATGSSIEIYMHSQAISLDAIINYKLSKLSTCNINWAAVENRILWDAEIGKVLRSHSFIPIGTFCHRKVCEFQFFSFIDVDLLQAQYIIPIRIDWGAVLQGILEFSRHVLHMMYNITNTKFKSIKSNAHTSAKNLALQGCIVRWRTLDARIIYNYCDRINFQSITSIAKAKAPENYLIYKI